MRAVNIVSRPAQLAFIVPVDKPEVAVKTVQSCCLSWGGYANYLIPYSRIDGIAADWLAVLRVLDPDAVVDCGGAILAEDKEAFGRYSGTCGLGTIRLLPYSLGRRCSTLRWRPSAKPEGT